MKSIPNENSVRPFRYVTSAYGSRYIGFLLVSLYSICRADPNSDVSVFWQDMDPKQIGALQSAFPRATFCKTNYCLNGNHIQRISSKVNLWERAVLENMNRNICILDSDTLVLRGVQHFFNDNFDIGFTVKDERFPINTGVLLVKNSEKTLLFFKEWKRRTVTILQDKELFSIANSSDHPYGGSDQMSFSQMIDYRKGKTEYDFHNENSHLRLLAFPCYVLNETNSRPITRTDHIIHYKGGWRNVLLRAHNFPKNRSRESSKEMYLLYLNTYQEAINLLSTYAAGIADNDFGIRIPFYLNRPALTENRILFYLHYLQNEIRTRFIGRSAWCFGIFKSAASSLNKKSPKT